MFYTGPKFRAPKKVNFDMARTSIEEGIDNFIESISVKKGVYDNFVA